jgi:CheY-like chemotaxis protein
MLQQAAVPRTTGGAILIVEDDATMRQTLEELLQDHGYGVITAAGGFEALYQLENQPTPRLILLDLMMGLMSGWEFRQRQRQNPRLADIPTIVVSGVPDLETQAERLGAAGFVAKPVDVARLLAAIDQCASV